MSGQIIGKLKAPKSRKEFEVKWDSSEQTVYISWGGWTKIGKAKTPTEAMNLAEAWLYDK